MEVYLCMGSIEIMKLSCQELRENDLRHIKIHYSLENRSMEVYIWECQCTNIVLDEKEKCNCMVYNLRDNDLKRHIELEGSSHHFMIIHSSSGLLFILFNV